ncbi:agmatinase [Candidatus Poribacteria bacterium]|nr:agmatinase [Candidatus Poribacteria bacterium]
MNDTIRNSGSMPEEWFYPSSNFGALPPELCDEKTSRIIVLPVPYEATTTYSAGCRRGPAAIIEASTNMELYDEELRREPCEVGIHTSKPLAVVDDAEEMVKRIDSVAGAYLAKGKFVTLLGGEHSVTLGMVRALSRFYSDLSVLVLDAHADFRESYHGNKYNHACVARRAAEVCPLVQAGIRSLSAEEAFALDKENVTTLWAQDFRQSRGAADQSELIRRLLKNLTAHVYVSIDADAFDPSIMPAVGTPEPGGLLWDEVLNVLRSVVNERKVVGLDLVELAPIPGLIHPEFMGARLLYKTWGYALKPE